MNDNLFPIIAKAVNTSEDLESFINSPTGNSIGIVSTVIVALVLATSIYLLYKYCLPCNCGGCNAL